MLKQNKKRKLNRLKNYDYSRNGFYFVTICIKNRECLFGNVLKEKMVLNDYGNIVKDCWLDLPNHYLNCVLDVFIIMPNHFHGIVIIDDDKNTVGTDSVGTGFVRTGFKPVPTEKKHGLSEFIRGFKTFSSKKINKNNMLKKFAWQRSFHDHIIRNEKSLNNIRNYIIENPKKWELDRYYKINN